MTKNGQDPQIESESVVRPVDPQPTPPHELPVEMRIQMFAAEYNALCNKWKVALAISSKRVTPVYVVCELVPVPHEQIQT